MIHDQPNSRGQSPPSVASESNDLPIIGAAYCPDVKQVVNVMKEEVTMFMQILEDIEALSVDRQEVKGQTQQFSERLLRQGEVTHQQQEADFRHNQHSEGDQWLQEQIRETASRERELGLEKER